eukprot:2982886-Amphidinium_carterae.1
MPTRILEGSGRLCLNLERMMSTPSPSGSPPKTLASGWKASGVEQGETPVARLCPSGDGPDGARRATLAQSLADYKEVKMAGWPFQGPGAVLELLKGIEATGLSLTTFHSHWAKSSGVNVPSAVSIEHSLNLRL